MENNLISELRVGRDYTSYVKSFLGSRLNQNTPVINKKTIATIDFIKRMGKIFNPTNNTRSDNLILPDNCKFKQTFAGNYNLYVVEETPRLRSIRVNISLGNTIENLRATGKLELFGVEDQYPPNKCKGPYNFVLAFPYVVYFIVERNNALTQLKIFYRLEPLKTTSDYLINPNLSNISPTFDVCLGHQQFSSTNSTEFINEVTNLFWGSEFNNDYIDCYLQYSDVEEVKDFITWSYYTKQDPRFIFKTKWMYNKYNVMDTINNIIQSRDSSYNTTVGNYVPSFEAVKDIFFKRYIKERDKDNNLIFENLTDSVIIEDEVYHVGDPFKYKNNQTCYIDAISGARNSHPSYIKIETDNGNFESIPISIITPYLRSKETKNMTIKKFKMNNGLIVKIGDFLKHTYRDITRYHKLLKIRQGRHGFTEFLLGNDYYIAEFLNIEIIDVNNILVSGINLKRNQRYYLQALDTYEWSSIPGVIEVSFLDFNVSNRYGVRAEFREVQSGRKIELSVSSNSTNYMIHKAKECKEESIFIVVNGSNIQYNTFLIKNNNEILRLKDRGRSGRIEEFYKEKVNKFLSNRNNTFTINLIDGIDIFNVGEKIILFDWTNPQNLIKPKIIHSFFEDDSCVDVFLKEENSNSTDTATMISIRLVNKNNNKYSNGVIRKIFESHENVLRNSVIKAKEGGISNFPKKDLNKIIGFIMDAGNEPLVLCSNCCTLWYSDLIEQFDIFSPGEMDNRNITPINLDKIKTQDGDLFTYHELVLRNPIYLIYESIYSYVSQTLSVISISNINSYFNEVRKSSTFERDYIRHGLILPRLKKTELLRRAKIKGMPNFKGCIYETTQSRLAFRKNEKREVNKNV